MCRSLRVLCAASDAQGVGGLKRASMRAEWEVVGGAVSVPDLAEQLGEWRPDVVVIDAALGDGAFDVCRRLRPTAGLVSLGRAVGADRVAETMDEVHAAILGFPKPGGPVRA